jgi:hypothetical protein
VPPRTAAPEPSLAARSVLQRSARAPQQDRDVGATATSPYDALDGRETASQRSAAAETKEAIRMPTEWLADPALPAQARTALARRAKGAEVEQLFAAAGIPFPPAELLWRAFKREAELEVWASSEPGGRMTRIATYGICAGSGDLGPKRAEGDGQVPEGFYRIAYLWPLSAFHLSMNVGYPNRSDRILGGANPGSAIMIHGNCVSIGCLAMSDERIQELWVMASAMRAQGQRVHLHLLPGRGLDALLQDEVYRRHWAFWRNLREGLDLFDEHRRLLNVEVDWSGRYRFSLPPARRAARWFARSN